MAARSLGTLTIDLVAKIGGFTRGMTEAERVADRASRDIARKQRQRALEVERAWEGAFKAVGVAVAGVAAAAGAAFAILNRQIENIAGFKDLSEQIGDTAEAVASLKPAADTSEVAMDSVAAASVRLTASLSKTDDESKAVGQAIQALGLEFNAFKALSPVQQLETLADAMAKFEDGSEKTAIAVALFGKAGAQLIPFLNDLSERTKTQTRLTQEQIEAADAYVKSQAALRSEFERFIQVQSANAIPVMRELHDLLATLARDQATLEVVTSVVNTAMKAAIVIFQTLAVVASDVGFVFLGVGREIGAWAAQIGALARGDLRGFRAISDMVKEDAARARKELDAFQARVMSLGSGSNLAADAGINSPIFNVPRPRLDISGLAGTGAAKKAKEEIDEVAKAISELQEQLALFDQDDTFTKAFKLEGLGATTEQVREYREALSRLEELKADQAIRKTIDELVKQREEIGLNNEQLTIHRLVLQGASADQIQYAQSVLAAASAAREQQAALEEGKRLYDETRTPAEQLNIRLGKLNDLLQKGAIDWDTYARAVFKAQDDFDNATKKTTETVDSFSKRFAENTQDFFGQGLYDLMTGNFKNIGDAFANMVTRMIAEAAAADLAKYLFGDLVKGGSGGGLLGGLFSGITGLLGFADGGNPPVGVASLVGEEGPELFVPRTAGTIVPASETASLLRGGGGMTVTQNFTISGPADRRTQEQIAAAAARGVQLATMRGTA